MQKIKMFFNKTQIIGEIFSTIMVIILPFLPSKFISIGWFLVSLTCFGDAIFAKKWSIPGRTWSKEIDYNPQKQLSRKYGDKITLWIASLGIILCPIAFFESFFSKNYIALLLVYSASTIVLIALYILTDRENKEVIKMIPKIRK